LRAIKKSRGDVIAPFWSDSGLLVEDLDGAGRADSTGSFSALPPLR